ncbi:uncharacterized protein LOC110456566 [Mizuhopecten yessoensis]|uniref:Glutathione S-transferase GstB n=1 Tax=Mizuhopecten yessoensis TaxID=6573 RepID=A0A210QAN8_MIZYE|nr:uncharacterized protein LOC110456566 [Mizuhopecten yessoensis]OWF45796.1 Glutathione S-transferase GstB [Mizuhopecten yessoensis]
MANRILPDGIWPLIGTIIGAVVFWICYRRITRKTRARIKEGSLKSKFELPDGVSLFDNSHSVCARRVRIALLEKNIPFTKINIDLTIGEQFTKEYLAINSNGKVPAIHIKNVQDVPDCTLYESHVIIEYLDSVFPGTSLYPDDPRRRTCVRMWQEWEQQLAQDYMALLHQNLLGFLTRLMFGSVKVLEESLYDSISTTANAVYLRSCEGTYKTDAELEHHAFACYKMLYMLEKELGEEEYLVGDSLSAADIAVFPLISMFPVIGLPIPQDIFPNVTRYMKELGTRESFARSEDVDIQRLCYFITRFERVFVWISNLRSGDRHFRFNGSAALSRASALYKDVSEYDDMFDGKTNGRTLTEVPLSAETWQSTLLMMEKEMSFRLANGDVIDLIGRSSGCSRLQCLKEGDWTVVGQLSTLEYIDRTGSGQNFMPTDPLKKAYVQCWQAWEQAMYESDISPLIENKILSQVLVTRYQDNIDSLMQLECSPHHSDKFPVIVKCFLLGMRNYNHHVTDMLSKYSLEDLPSQEEQRESYTSHRENILTQLDYLESALRVRVYLVGDEVTLADMCVFCRLKQLTLLDIDIVVNRYPCVSKWMAKLTERPGFFAIAASAKLPLQL